MTDSTLEFKKEYNALIKRQEKGEEFLHKTMDDESIPIEKRCEHIKMFNAICARLDWLLQQIGRYTREEFAYGFDLPIQDGLFEGVKPKEVIV